MTLGFSFFFTNILLGVGLAMDAFSVSLANGLHEPCMKTRKMCGIAGIFAVFQGVMPMIGWICVHTIVQYFQSFEKLIPWIALFLLCFIGGKMLIEGIKGEDGCDENAGVGLAALMVQGVATSIDALSVGFTIAEYGFAGGGADCCGYVCHLPGRLVHRPQGRHQAGWQGGHSGRCNSDFHRSGNLHYQLLLMKKKMAESFCSPPFLIAEEFILP